MTHCLSQSFALLLLTVDLVLQVQHLHLTALMLQMLRVQGRILSSLRIELSNRPRNLVARSLVDFLTVFTYDISVTFDLVSLLLQQLQLFFVLGILLRQIL